MSGLLEDAYQCQETFHTPLGDSSHIDVGPSYFWRNLYTCMLSCKLCHLWLSRAGAVLRICSEGCSEAYLYTDSSGILQNQSFLYNHDDAGPCAECNSNRRQVLHLGSAGLAASFVNFQLARPAFAAKRKHSHHFFPKLPIYSLLLLAKRLLSSTRSRPFLVL